MRVGNKKGVAHGYFEGKTVIVTGGGKATLKDGSAGSIGYGIDVAFAKEGANLVITGRNPAKLDAAKEGIRGLTRVAATEWGPDGINVNIVAPLAWTAALEGFKDAYPEAYEANVHMPPMGHYGDVEQEIGRVVVQLCGPDFKYMTGETLTLEGGLGQRP